MRCGLAEKQAYGCSMRVLDRKNYAYVGVRVGMRVGVRVGVCGETRRVRRWLI